MRKKHKNLAMHAVDQKFIFSYTVNLSTIGDDPKIADVCFTKNKHNQGSLA